MNKNRRKMIRKIVEQLGGLKEELDNVKDEEQEALDSMPENLQESERGEEMQTAIDVMEDACGDLESILYNLGEMLEG